MKENKVQKLKTFVVGLVVGGVLIGGGVYASTVSASNVSYSNNSSGISATNVQSAVDSIYKESTCLAKERQSLLKAIYTMNEYYKANDTVSTSALISKLGSSQWYIEGSQMTWMASQINTCAKFSTVASTHRNCMMTNIKDNYESVCSS